MSEEKHIKNIMWAASKLAFSIVDGKLPKDYKTRIDYKYKEVEGNCYQIAEFKGDVYSYTGGIESIHAGLVGISKGGIIISLRGTDGNDTEIGEFLDWMNNFLAMQASFAPYGKGNVHLGFLGAVVSIKDAIIKKTRELLQEAGNKENSPVIYITGHSKGGAMAAIMAKVLQQQFTNKIVVYTFGAPRVGDDIFRQYYKVPHFRYESFLDIVSHLSFSGQELELIPRMGIFHEILSPILVFPAYAPVGTGICIYKPRRNYGLLPWNTDNSLEEKLDSFCAIEQVVRSGEFQIFADVHGNDYY
ncbi:MAG: lipase family protein [Anaerocolumna sp.]